MKKLFRVSATVSTTVVAENVDIAKVAAAKQLGIDIADKTLVTEFISDVNIASIRTKK